MKKAFFFVMWAQAILDGHELGNHTKNHQSNGSIGDVDAATTFLQQKFGITPYTMAAPYGNTSYVSIAELQFLLNRGVSGGSIGPNDTSNPFNLPSYIPPQNASATAFNNIIDSARNAGRWQIILLHGFTGGSDGAYQPVDITQCWPTAHNPIQKIYISLDTPKISKSQNLHTGQR